MKPTLPLYEKWHSSKGYELASLFEKTAEHFGIQSALYPGCYMHITPSFYIPKVVYVDSEKPAKKFFDDENVVAYIESRKTYDEYPDVTFYHQSYNDPIDEPEESFDLLISQYAGFVAPTTKKYLKKGGILLANNSHGDAGLASIDSDFKFVAVETSSGNIFEKNLDQYFIPKKDIKITESYLKDLGRGLGYTKTAPHYFFQKL